jgi:hypothetical protein
MRPHASAQFQGVSVPPACFRVPTSQYSGILAQFVVIVVLLCVAAALNAAALRETACPPSRRTRCCGGSRVQPHALAYTPPPAAGGPVGDVESPSARSDAAAAGKDAAPQASSLQRGLNLMRRLAFVLLFALYGTVVGTALTMLRCQPVDMRVRTYIRLDVDGTALRAAGLMDDVDLLQRCDDFAYQTACAGTADVLDSAVTVSLLTANPNAVCWESAHRMAAGMALVLLAVYVIGFPLALGWTLHARRRLLLQRLGLLAAWDALWRADAEAAATEVEVRSLGADGCGRQAWARVHVAVCWPRMRKRDPALQPLSAAPAPLTSALSLQFGWPGAADATVATSPAAAGPAQPPSPDDAMSPRRLGDGHAAGGTPVVTVTAVHAAAVDADAVPSTVGSWLVPAPGTQLASPRVPDEAQLPPTADECPAVADDVLFFGPSRGEYRLSQTWFLSVHMALLAVVTAVQVSWGEVTSTATAAGQAACVGAALLLTLVVMWLHDPHKRGEGLQPYLDYYSLVLALLQAVLNALAAVVTIAQQQPPPASGASPALQGAYTAVAYLATLAALGLFLLVVVAFVEALWRGGSGGSASGSVAPSTARNLAWSRKRPAVEPEN